MCFCDVMKSASMYFHSYVTLSVLSVTLKQLQVLVSSSEAGNATLDFIYLFFLSYSDYIA